METYLYHRFLDEAGDSTFYGKGKVPIVGQQGVSNVFILGMLKMKEPLKEVREKIEDFQKEIQNSKYYRNVPSVLKRVNQGKFYFHAKDDLPEIRKEFYDFILKLDCSFQAVVGRKILGIFENQHKRQEAEFYADLLSHLLKDKLQTKGRLILDIAEKGSSTSQHNLEKGLEKAKERFLKKNPQNKDVAIVNFSVHKFTAEPILSVADYFCWAIQRVFEKGETRYYDYTFDKISLVLDLYDKANYKNSKNYYRKGNPLTQKNKVSPQTP